MRKSAILTLPVLCLALGPLWGRQPEPKRDRLFAVIEAARQSGYDEGYLAARDAVARRYEVELRYAQDGAERAAEYAAKYERCLEGMKIARQIGPYAMDSAILTCEQIKPPAP